MDNIDQKFDGNNQTLNIAKIIGKKYYKKKEIESFFYEINKHPIYEENIKKEPHVAYFNAIRAVENSGETVNGVIPFLVEALRKLNWITVADELLNLEIQRSENNLNDFFYNIPHKNQAFVGRDKEMEEIENLLNEKGDYALVTACTGLGGIGKTSFTTEYVWRNREKYTIIAWFESENIEFLHSQFIRFAENRKITKEGNKKIEPILEWFNNNPGWLIIFDNVENFEEIKNYSPIQGGKIIITSRNRNFKYPNYNIELDKYTLEEVKLYLIKNMPKSEYEESLQKGSIENFAKELHFHPLAITHAAIYIHNEQISIDKYLEINEEQKQILFSHDAQKQFHNYMKSYQAVYDSLMISVVKIFEENSSSINILKKCAFLFPDKIPSFLFSKIEQGLSCLKKYSLIANINDDFFSIHRLVQQSILFNLKFSSDQTSINEMFPPDSLTKEFSETYNLIESFYPLGKLEQEDLQQKSYLLPHFGFLLNHGNENENILTKPLNSKVHPKNLDILHRLQTLDEQERMANLKEFRRSSSSEMSRIGPLTYISRFPSIRQKLMDALDYLESSIKEISLVERKKYLKKAQAIMKKHLSEHHELIADISFRKIFTYIELSFKIPAKTIHYINKAKAVKDTLNFDLIKIDSNNEVTQSFKYETNGYFSGQLNDRKNQLNFYLNAYEIQLDLLNKNNEGWINLCESILNKKHDNDEDYKKFEKVLKINQIKKISFNSLENMNYKYLINNWIENRLHSVPKQRMFYEIVRIDLNWNDIYHEFPMNYEISNNSLLLHKAAIGDQTITMKNLLEGGADVNEIDEFYKTALHYAVEYGVRTSQLLLKNEATVDSKDKFKRTPLHYAAMKNNIKTAKLLLHYEAKVDSVDDMDQTSLHIAAENGNIELGKLLIKHQANLQAKDKNGNTPLHLSAKETNFEFSQLLLTESSTLLDCFNIDGFTPLHLSLSKWTHNSFNGLTVLVENNANVNSLSTNEFRNTPLHLAVILGNDCRRIIELLINQKADINAVDFYGKSALHYAVETENVRLVEFLIQKSITFDSSDDELKTPLHYAALKADPEMLMLLFKYGANVNAIDKNKLTPLHYAVISGNNINNDLIASFLEKGGKMSPVDFRGKTPLHYAAQGGNINNIEVLLNNGAEVDAIDNKNLTPLLVASKNSTTDGEIIRLLCEKGANIKNAIDGSQKTSLHWAAEIGNKSVVEILCSKGFDINAVDIKKRTPLHFAVEKNHYEVAKYLLTIDGIDFDAGNNKNQTALHHAAANSNRKIMLKLFKKGAKPNALDEDERTPLHYATESVALMGNGDDVIQLIKEKGGKINLKDKNGKTALHYATLDRNIVKINVLLKYKAKINSKDQYKMTSLHIAARCSSLEIVKLFCEKNALIDAVDNEGKTALHYAAEIGNFDIVDHLLCKNASPHIQDNDKETPLFKAVRSNAIEIATLLIKKGAKMDCINRNNRNPLEEAMMINKDIKEQIS